MMKTILAAIALALMPMPAGASGPEQSRSGIGLGAGIVYGGASSPLRAFDGAAGVGLEITMESRLNDYLLWDLRAGGFYTPIGEPEEIYYPADDGDWAFISTALRFEVTRNGNVTWWAGPEGSLHYAQMENFDYVGSGFGVGPAFGAHVPFWNHRLVARLGGHLSWVWLETDTAEPSRPTFVGMVAFDVLYLLRRA